MEITKSILNDLSYQLTGAAIEVHKTLGPGLLESIYHQCLKHELTLRGINFISEMIVPVKYKDMALMSDLRCDLLIENCMVAELKSVETILPVHEAQLMTYMKLIKAPRGIILNFNVANLFYEGRKTYVNEFFTDLKEK